MAETTTTPRLMAAAKEFNIGKDTLVDFLVNKGFDKDELKPTAKLSEDMYRALQAEFQSDKVATQKTIQIDLPKGSAAEAKKKKDEEEISFRKEEKKAAVKKEEQAPAAPAEVPAEQPVPEIAQPEPQPPSKPEPPPQPQAERRETEVATLEAPELEGPKVIDKIDLSAIDSSTRPKKSTKKTAKKDEPEVSSEPQPELQPSSAAQPPSPPEPAQQPADQPVQAQEEEEPVIENIKAEKIEGPKILGKIDLPVENDTRPKLDEKHKRKRIPIEQKDGPPGQGFQRGGTGQAGTTGQGGGGRFGVQRNTGGDRGRGGVQPGGNRFGGANRTGQRPAFAKRGEDKQIDEKEIQRK